MLKTECGLLWRRNKAFRKNYFSTIYSCVCTTLRPTILWWSSIKLQFCPNTPEMLTMSQFCLCKSAPLASVLQDLFFPCYHSFSLCTQAMAILVLSAQQVFRTYGSSHWPLTAYMFARADILSCFFFCLLALTECCQIPPNIVCIPLTKQHTLSLSEQH